MDPSPGIWIIAVEVPVSAFLVSKGGEPPEADAALAVALVQVKLKVIVMPTSAIRGSQESCAWGAAGGFVGFGTHFHPVVQPLFMPD